MSSPGLQVGRVLGVPVFVSPSWLLFAAFVVLSLGPTFAGEYGSGPGYVAAGAFALLLLVSVLMHEIGHCVVARAFDLPVTSITVTFLAGLTEITKPPQTPAREYAVAVIGPMVSLLLAAVGYASIGLFEDGSLLALLAELVAVSNGLVAAFNLLPGLPLDGGRVLHSALWRLTGDQARSTRLAARAGQVVGAAVVPALLLGLLPALGVTERSVTAVLFTALVGTFIYVGASATLQRTAFLARVPRATVQGLATPALAVQASVPLAEAVRQAQVAGLRAVVVVDGTGEPTAVVSEAAVLAVPEGRRPWVSVSTVARRLEPGMVLDASLSGEPLLAAMRATPATEYVVTAPLRVLVAADVAAVVAPT